MPLVGVIERGANLAQHVLHERDGHWSILANCALERPPRNVLHNEREPVLQVLYPEQWHHVRMTQRGHQLRFAREPGYRLGIIIGANHFDGDVASELALERAIHHRSAAAPQLAEDLVFGIQLREASFTR